MDAQTEARNLGGESVGTEHLLVASSTQSDGLQASLERCGLDANKLRGPLKGGGELPGLGKLFANVAKDELLPFAKDAERAFKTSLAECKDDVRLVTSRDIVLALLRDQDRT